MVTGGYRFGNRRVIHLVTNGTRVLGGGGSILKYVYFAIILITCMLSDGNHAYKLVFFVVSYKPAC